MSQMREYTTLRALRTGETIDFEGVAFRATHNQDLAPGDTYIAERNRGPMLLTVDRHVVEDNLVGGYVIPVESAYPYDRAECVKVEMVEDQE